MLLQLRLFKNTLQRAGRKVIVRMAGDLGTDTLTSLVRAALPHCLLTRRQVHANDGGLGSNVNYVNVGFVNSFAFETPSALNYGADTIIRRAGTNRLTRLGELQTRMVLASRPVEIEGRRLNQGFAWTREDGYRGSRAKFYLPDEPDGWEASWFDRGDREFSPDLRWHRP